VTIPPNGQARITVAQSQATQSVQQFAAGKIAVINAGFFDPSNRKTASYVTIAGAVVADPRQNERLMQNPKLKPYLNQIFNRSEFRRYQCGQQVNYAIALHNAPVPQGCELVDAVGGGPQLLPKLTAVAEGFVDPNTDRDAIGMNQRNARSAIGIKPDGTVLLVLAAQKPTGVSLPELAKALQELGAESALNLDGGSSSALVYRGKAIYGKVEEPRPVKSVVIVE
jgi:exopolysaccharide biosynthesis protein